jgi:hypothetical protein
MRKIGKFIQKLCRNHTTFNVGFRVSDFGGTQTEVWHPKYHIPNTEGGEIHYRNTKSNIELFSELLGSQTRVCFEKTAKIAVVFFTNFISNFTDT